MARLVLFLFLVAVLLLAVAAAVVLARVLRPAAAPKAPQQPEALVPAAVRSLCFALLLILLLGVASGWLGP